VCLYRLSSYKPEKRINIGEAFYLLILFVVFKNKFQTLYKATKIIGFILIIQIVLGILTLLSGAQIIISSMHQISSIFLVSSSVYLVYLNLNTNLQLLD